MDELNEHGKNNEGIGWRSAGCYLCDNCDSVVVMIGGHGADNDLEGNDDGDNNSSVDDGRWQ